MLRFVVCAILIALCPGIVFAKKKKKLSTADVIAASDSLLRQQMGDSLFRFCKMEESSYYRCRKGKKIETSDFTKVKPLSKSFERADIFYRFNMPYGECSLYDTVSGLIAVQVIREDSTLKFSAPADVSFIPEIAAGHAPCNFITAEEAISIAQGDTLLAGITAPYAELHYIPTSKTFAWVVLSLLWKERNFYEQEEAQKDMVVIDAERATVIRHSRIPYTADISSYLQP